MGFFKRSDEVAYKTIDPAPELHNLDSLPPAEYNSSSVPSQAPSGALVENLGESTAIVSEPNV